MEDEAAYYVYDPITSKFFRKTRKISLSPYPGLHVRESGLLNYKMAIWVCEVDNVVDDNSGCEGCVINQCIVVLSAPFEMNFKPEQYTEVLKQNGWAEADLPDGVTVHFVDLSDEEES